MDSPLLYFYNDSNIVGGHEILTARIVNFLSDNLGAKVHFSFYCEDMHQHLSPSVKTSPLPFHSKTLQCFHNSQFDLRLLGKQIKALKPELAVISQGYIESGIRGLSACKLGGVKTGSYIPFGNTNRELASKYAAIRDRLTKPVFAMNEFYITISSFQARMLKRLISSQPVHVINNPVAYTPIDPVIPRGIPNIDENRALNIAVIGRILFKQKNQNCLPPVAKLLADRNFNVHFHIVGDGPDRSTLETLIANSGTQSQFIFHNWLDKSELANLLSTSVDAVILPSHYEGLPLVMLESIFQAKPVLVSNMPFIEDYKFPDEYIFDGQNSNSIVNSIVKLPTSKVAENVERLQKQIQETNSFERFCQDIEACFSSLLSSST